MAVSSLYRKGLVQPSAHSLALMPQPDHRKAGEDKASSTRGTRSATGRAPGKEQAAGQQQDLVQLLVKDFPWRTTQDELREVFQKTGGEVAALTPLKGPRNLLHGKAGHGSMRTGRALVALSAPPGTSRKELLEKALALDGTMFFGRCDGCWAERSAARREAGAGAGRGGGLGLPHGCCCLVGLDGGDCRGGTGREASGALHVVVFSFFFFFLFFLFFLFAFLPTAAAAGG